MTESKPHKQRLPHRALAIRHALQRSLLIMHLLVLCHVRLVAEVVKVARVGLGVEFGHKGRALRAQGGPVYFGKVLVRVDGLDVGEAFGF